MKSAFSGPVLFIVKCFPREYPTIVWHPYVCAKTLIEPRGCHSQKAMNGSEKLLFVVNFVLSS